MKYRIKPARVIEAFQFGIESMPDWFMNEVTKNNVILMSEYPKNHPLEKCKIHQCCRINIAHSLLYGSIVEYGHFISKDSAGDLGFYTPDFFKQEYEKI